MIYSLALASLVFMLSYVPMRLSEKSRMIFFFLLLFFTQSKSPLSVFVFYDLCDLHLVSPTTCSFLRPPLFWFLRHHVCQPLPSSLIVPLSLPQPLLGGLNGRYRDWMCYQSPVGKGPFNGSFAWSHKCQNWTRLGLAFFVHWSKNGEGRAPALKIPSPQRKGNKGILRDRRQTRHQVLDFQGWLGHVQSSRSFAKSTNRA